MVAVLKVRGGSHSPNPGFLSTEGVQIVMKSFSNIYYELATWTANIGMGSLWGQVYSTLGQWNVTIVGERDHSVGVGGFVLQGEYSFVSNQHGLSVDNIITLELVMPNGTVATITLVVTRWMG
ncbi:hypothetical protein BDR04DRAFT_1008985 [Suillus decipiens]|nr:hypothetical protein BDR04DRAFT_1008985 [Suillus decipiens]